MAPLLSYTILPVASLLVLLAGLLLARPRLPPQIAPLSLKAGAQLEELIYPGVGPGATACQLVYMRRQADGLPQESDFGLATFPCPPLKHEEVRVKTKYISIDPGPLRGRLGHGGEVLPDVNASDPASLHAIYSRVPRADVIGTVVESSTPHLPVGTVVKAYSAWTSYTQLTRYHFEPLGAHHVPPTTALGVLGVTGRTAYYGVFEVLKPTPGEVLFVTGAAGATGYVAGQLGKIAGCRVFGSAGTAEKVRHLVEDLGFDGAFNYREEEPTDALRRLVPDGVDLLLENTGGPVSAAVMRILRPGARVAVSGNIHWYHHRPSLFSQLGALLMPGSVQGLLADLARPGSLRKAFAANAVLLRSLTWGHQIGSCNRSDLRKEISLGGVPITFENYLVICFDPDGGKARAEAAMADYVQRGLLRHEESVLQGSIQDVVRTAIHLFRGGNTGKQLLEVVD